MIFYTDYSLEGSNTFNIKAKANVFTKWACARIWILLSVNES